MIYIVSQVCAHIVAAISAEAQCFRDEWELSLCSDQPVSLTMEEGGPRLTDSYCYEMLSMVMALSGSSVGRLYLAQQYGLLKDLLSLLHTGTARVQRAVISVLRRVLPMVPPARFDSFFSFFKTVCSLLIFSQICAHYRCPQLAAKRLHHPDGGQCSVQVGGGLKYQQL